MMDSETATRLLRAARALLRMDAATFAGKVGVSVPTLKRVEAGHVVGEGVVEGMVECLRAAGVVVIPPHTLFPDVTVGLAVLAGAEIGEGHRPRSDVGPTSRKRPPASD